MLRSSQWEYAFVGSENQTFPLPILDDDEQSVFFSQSHPVPHDYTFHFLLSTDIMSDLKPESITKLASASIYPQWAADMSGYIRFAGSWKVVMSADTMPAPTEVAALKDWIEKDFYKVLGVAKDAPVGFKDIRLSFDLDTDADDETLATLHKLTERYCVVYQTLVSSPQVSLELGRHEAAAPA